MAFMKREKYHTWTLFLTIAIKIFLLLTWVPPRERNLITLFFLIIIPKFPTVIFT